MDKKHAFFLCASVPLLYMIAAKYIGFDDSHLYSLLCKVPLIDVHLPACQNDVSVSPTSDNDNKRSDLPPYSETDVYLLGMLKSQEDKKKKARGFSQHGFNEFVSEKIGMIREVPDVRNPVCKDKVYNSQLPTASIVMCFYNEAWSTLLRSIHNIFRQTPPHLLKEIILLDDYSSLDHLKSKLDNYIAKHFKKVKLIRSKERLGLIRARMTAASRAKGQVIVFLDSHIEAGEGWLEPLLDRIAQDRKTVVVPIVDTIEPESMIYRKAQLVRGGFTWSLLHNWESLPPDVEKDVDENANPFLSPTMPGGLFAMERDYFYELGEYDAGMTIWGGENMEISFRIWQCGGRLEIVPCSRVGHVFRRFRPYGSPKGEDTATLNAARVADVWLDDYKQHFFDVRPEAKTLDYGDVSDRIELRKRLKCKSFQWFLENIHPEQMVPGEKPKTPNAYKRRTELRKTISAAEGKLVHTPSGLCVRPENDPASKDDKLILTNCDLVDENSQGFALTTDNQFKLLGSRFCLETAESKKKGSSVYLMKCHQSGSAQTWLHVDGPDSNPVFYNPSSGECLAVHKADKNAKLVMDLCTSIGAQGFHLPSKGG